MTTQVTTHNPGRADLDITGDTTGAATSAPNRPTRRTSEGWALSGVAAGVLGIGTMVSSSMIWSPGRPERMTSTGVSRRSGP